MDINKILNITDHTNLSPTASAKDIKLLCDEGIKYNTASVCIAPAYVKQAKEYAGDKIKICTVIGFPNGYNSSAVKIYETKTAISDGADEIDMVINIGMLKEKRYSDILYEINSVKEICGDKILKVIVETCLLNQEEKIRICQTVSESNADFIKTSTGFSSGGATAEDIKLFKAHVFNGTLIKAAGGINSVADAETFIACGADRLGTSKLVKSAKEIL